MDVSVASLLSGSLSDSEATELLLQLRTRERAREHLAMLDKQVELKRQADSLRVILQRVRTMASDPQWQANRAPLFSNNVVPLRHRPEVYYTFRKLQRVIPEYYPGSDAHFDWAAHLDALFAAVDADEQQAMSLLSTPSSAADTSCWKLP